MYSAWQPLFPLQRKPNHRHHTAGHQCTTRLGGGHLDACRRHGVDDVVHLAAHTLYLAVPLQQRLQLAVEEDEALHLVDGALRGGGGVRGLSGRA